MGSKYDKPLTIVVTADDWRAAREEELRQERLEQKADRLGYSGPEYRKIEAQTKEYSCICVMAQAVERQIPGTTLSNAKNRVSVGGNDCTIRFRDGARREYVLDDLGVQIVDAFDRKVKRPKNRQARGPMPAFLREGVQVTLTPKGEASFSYGG